MWSILIRLLERVLDVKEVAADPKQRELIQGWMSQSWTENGFQLYKNARNAQLKDVLAGGTGGREEPRDDYVRKFGQRAEHLLFCLKCKQSFDKK